MDPLTLTSIFGGQAESEATGFAKRKVKDYLKKAKTGEALDQYDCDFKKINDTAITAENVDFESVIINRKDLLSKAKEHILSPYINSGANQKEQFVNEACVGINDHSEITKKYLRGFYDLVLVKETQDASDSEKALINFLSDQFNISINELKNDAAEIKRTVLRLTNKEPENADFDAYYERVKRRFTRKKKEEESPVGTESDKDAYIDAYTSVNGEQVPVLTHLDNWIRSSNYGTMLIHGEPGHGKTLLCSKAIFEYCEGRFLKDTATKVLAVSLNTGYNSGIIKDGEFHIDNVLSLGRGKNDKFSLDDCRGALLFIDGFDEFIDVAKKAGIQDIVSFMKIVDEIATDYDIHIVVLSRTIVVKSYLGERSISGKSYELSSLSRRQQDDWLYKHREYEAYKGTFNRLRNSQNMKELLEIPFLFRLIVHNRFRETSTTVVELYDKLIAHLMDKRDIRGTDLDDVIAGLEELSYKIYCDDTHTAVITEGEMDDRWIIAFYIKQYFKHGNKRRIGFYHRSFYQYFLAKFIYSGILDVISIGAETYIGYFAERELDDTVRKYLSLMIKEDDKEAIHTSLKFMVDALVESEAYLGFEPRCPSGDAEKKKIGRSTNIYRNTLHICAAFSYVIPIPFRDNIDILIRTYPSHKIRICSYDNKKAHLEGAHLEGANLIGAFLEEAHLREVHLREAHLEVAVLKGADLRRADLKGANLKGADLRRTDLKGANLDGAKLTEAHLEGANLDGAKLTEAHLREVHLEEAYLKGANLREANLEEAYLIGANLTEANLEGVNLREANLEGAYLLGANLEGAKMRGANLERAYLIGANLSIKSAYYMTLDSIYKDRIDPSVEGYDTIRWV